MKRDGDAGQAPKRIRKQVGEEKPHPLQQNARENQNSR